MKDEQNELLRQSQTLAEEALAVRPAGRPSATASSGPATDKTAAERLITNIPRIKAAMEKVGARFCHMCNIRKLWVRTWWANLNVAYATPRT